MIKVEAKIRDYWNSVDTGAMHRKHTGKTTALLTHYEEQVASKVDVKGKTVVDFGCGDGLLGKYLFDKHGLGRYVGYDISSVNLAAAKDNLAGKSHELILSGLDQEDFSAKCPDIFVSLACSIHFPTQAFLDGWLERVNNCGAYHLVIEIRDTGAGTRFDEVRCPRPWGTRTVCLTNEEHVSMRLSKYMLIDKTDREKNVINCQILRYKRVA